MERVSIDFLTALTRSKEKDLIPYDKLVRMASSESAEEGFKILLEGGFGKDAKAETVRDYENLIEKERENLLEYIKAYSTKPEFERLFVIDNDYHNAESLLRAEYLKLDEKKMLIAEGEYSIEKLKGFIEGKKGAELSRELEETILKAKLIFDGGDATGYKISNIFIKGKYAEEISLASTDKKLLRFVKAEIDALNVSTALRSRNKAVFEESFILGGEYSLNSLMPLTFLDYGEIPSKYRGSSVYDLVLAGVEAVKEGRPLTEFENLKDSFALKTLKEEKYTAYGFTEFLLYCYYKLAELKNVRIVMVGLIGGMNKNEIIKRVREGYAG